VDVTLAERFGWTFTELDEQDDARVLPTVSAANIHAALARVLGWRNAAGNGAKIPLPNEHDLSVWGDVQRVLRDNP